MSAKHALPSWPKSPVQAIKLAARLARLGVPKISVILRVPVPYHKMSCLSLLNFVHSKGMCATDWSAREQTAEHLSTRCRKRRKQRRKLVRELEKEGIKWQPQVERRWSAVLLGDEKAVAPLLKFLKNTGIGGREGAGEKELEREQRNDQACENLLG